MFKVDQIFHKNIDKLMVDKETFQNFPFLIEFAQET